MYSPVVYAVSHTMNKNISKPPGQKSQQKKPARSGPKRNVNTNQGVRNRPGRFAENPSTRVFPDTALSLTRSQFTATAPQNYWDIYPASTPGGMRVKGRELLTAVTLSASSTGSFQLAGLPSNTYLPLNPLSFPRLAQISNAFEDYIFHKADLLFQSNQPTTSTGSIMICAEYDPSEAQPTSTIGFMRNITSTIANIYSDCSCQATRSLSRLPWFVVVTGGAGNINQFDQAMISVGIEGYTGTSGATVGYLVVEYDVEFKAPH